MANKRIILGVVGAGQADRTLSTVAETVGRLAAQRGWVLVTGGLGGVMEAASRGASEAGGLVVGIVPTADRHDANPWVEVPIVTNMGHARNIIIAHTADVLVAVDGSYGTMSEVAIARKLGKSVAAVVPRPWADTGPGLLMADTPEAALEMLESRIG